MLTKQRVIFRTSKQELFAKIMNSFKRLSIFATCSITDICYGSEYVYEKMLIYHSLDCPKFNLEQLMMDNLTQRGSGIAQLGFGILCL